MSQQCFRGVKNRRYSRTNTSIDMTKHNTESSFSNQLNFEPLHGVSVELLKGVVKYAKEN